MVISNLIGGLGNQMFQYAVGRACSLRLSTSLRLDISSFANYGLHQGFELQRIFSGTVVVANEMDVRSILGWQFSSGIRRLVLRRSMAKFRREEFIAEPHFHYWSGIRNISSDCYLLGYWQSEKYFFDVAAQIREDFSFRLPMASKNAELVDQISQVNAVSLHIRRGDYANNPRTTATHGLCSLDYYRASIQYVAERVQQPHFFIFSDDLAWVKNNLEIEFPHEYVDWNQGEESYNDMRLMSMCKHHIIANSSFSWWGAWLNPKRDKIVVAPKNWFANQTDASDLLPQSWVKL
jgi:hypothetical protein